MGYPGVARVVPSAQPARVPLVEYVADQVASVVRLTVAETEDVPRDIELLRSIHEVIERHPGANRVLMRVMTLDGKRPLLRWDAFADSALRHELGLLLARRAVDAQPTGPAPESRPTDSGGRSVKQGPATS